MCRIEMEGVRLLAGSGYIGETPVEFAASALKIALTGCVAKNKLGHKNTGRNFSSSGNLEEVGHESNLSANVAFPNSFNLPLPDHVRDLIPADGPPRRLEAEEAESPPPLRVPRRDSR